LSIDIALGALASGSWVVKLTQADPGPGWWILLPMVVWLIYTTDHLIDGFRLKKHAGTIRHLYHYTNRKWLIFILIVCFLIALGVSLTNLRNEILIFGIFLGSLVILYLLTIWISGRRNLNFIFKEVVIAIIYTCGICGGPVIISEFAVGTLHILLFFSFFLIVLSNIIIFTLHEKDTDRIDRQSSLLFIVGDNTARIISISCLLLSVISCIICILFSDGLAITVSGVILIIMAAILYFILLKPVYFNLHSRYRYLGDSIFFLPALINLF